MGDEAVTRKKALIIAVSEYDKANHLDNLPFCKNDGNEMIDILKSQGYEILDNHNLVGYVKYDVMWKAINDFFDDSKITFNDVLLVYYSGHGFYYPGREKFTPDVCLGSSETNPDHPRRDGIPYNEIERLASSQSCSARSVVIILDCCHSGAAILGSKGDDEGPKIITDVFDKQPPSGEGRCLLAASQQYEEAYALIEENHSIFTHYLLKGLRGEKKSVDDNGNVTAFTLGRYVFNTISSLDSKKRPKQKPVIKAETSGDIVLAEYPYLKRDYDHRIPPRIPEPYPKSNGRRLPNNWKILLITIVVVLIGVVITIYVTIHPPVPINHQPITNDQIVTISLNNPINITLIAKDLDIGDNLTASVISKPLHGILGEIDQNNGNVTYTPNPGFLGLDKFTFKVNDGKTDSNPGVITIAVTNNHPPIAYNQSVITNKNTPNNITLKTSDLDLNDTLSPQLVVPPVDGRLSEIDQNSGNVTYTPNPDFTGVDKFTFKVNDGKTDSNMGTILITVRNP